MLNDYIPKEKLITYIQNFNQIKLNSSKLENNESIIKQENTKIKEIVNKN